MRLRAVWMTNHLPSVLWRHWLGHQTSENVFEMTYTVLSGLLHISQPANIIMSITYLVFIVWLSLRLDVVVTVGSVVQVADDVHWPGGRRRRGGRRNSQRQCAAAPFWAETVRPETVRTETVWSQPTIDHAWSRNWTTWSKPRRRRIYATSAADGELIDS